MASAKKTANKKLKPWKYYDSIADGYDSLHGEEQIEKYKEIEKLLKPKKNNRLLDVGCGTCLSFDYFECNVEGIEPSKKMVDEYKKNGGEKKVVVAPAEQLGKHFKPRSFDYVICVTSAHHFSNPESVFRQMITVAKPDARFAFSLLKKSSNTDKIIIIIESIYNILEITGTPKDNIILCTAQKEKFL